MNKYIQILGINHLRLVGIAKDTGEAFDFYIYNYGGYRPPQTRDELLACIKKAKKYYDDCYEYGTAIDRFEWEEVYNFNDLIERSYYE